MRTVVTERDCFRHKVIEVESDPRVVRVACGIRVAVIGLPRCRRLAIQRCPFEALA